MRIDEYGHIIDDDELETSEPISDDASVSPTVAAVPSSNPMTSALEVSVPWYGHSELYWTVTLGLTTAIAWFAYVYLAPILAGDGSSSSNDIEGVVLNFVGIVTPYLLAGGAFIGCIWYNIGGTRKTENYYIGGNYVLSPICAALAVLGMAILIFVITIIAIIALDVLVFCLGLAFLGILGSGG